MSDTAVNKVLQYGTHAARLAFVPNPATGSQIIYIWYETDTGNFFIYTTTWQGPFSSSAGALTKTGSPAAGNLAAWSGASSLTNGDLTGPVTTSGTLVTTLANNAVATVNIANNAVTFAKLPLATGNGLVLGSGAAGIGIPYSEITLGTNLSMSGTTLNASGGTGSVTHTVGALALNNLVVGNAAADIKTAAATDGQIPIGKSSDGSVNLANITAGTGITITNSAGGITIASTGGGGGGLVLLQTYNASGASSVDITSQMSGTYDSYRLMLRSIAPSSTTRIYILASTDNGVTWIGGTAYSWGAYFNYSTSSGVMGSNTADSQWVLRDTTSTIASGGSYNGEFDLFDANNTSRMKVIRGDIFINDGSIGLIRLNWWGNLTTLTAINALRVIAQSGTITGKVSIYGYAQ